MNRSIIYSGEQTRSFDFEWSQRDALAALGSLELLVAGASTTVVSGLQASQAAPPSLSIALAQGIIAQQFVMDSSSFGSLPADSNVVQQIGFAATQSVLLTTAALTSGHSQWALVEAQFAQVDVIRTGDPTGGLLYYYNSASPTQPLQGPGGNGQTQPTERQATTSVRVVYGSPAITGSEVPPQPDAGWVGLYLVDLTFGQTTILNNQILVAGPSVGSNVPSNYPGAPFMAGLLNQHHKGTAGQAPKIVLTSEVQGLLPLANVPASNITGGLPVMRLVSTNPNGNLAGNANVNGAADFAFDNVALVLYICTTTGSVSTAVWTAATGQTSSTFAGGTSTGSPNAQVVASTTPAGFSLTAGYVVTFTAGFTNTTAATLNVDATGVKAIQKNTGAGNVPLAGGEIIVGNFISVIYTGTVYLLQSATLGQLATLNIGLFLKNDGAGNLTLNLASSLGNDGTGKLTVAASGVTAGTYRRPILAIGADGRVTVAIQGIPATRTVLTSGSGTYTTPGNTLRLNIRMVAAGGGGGGSGSPTGSAGGNGTASSFNSIVANGGAAGAGAGQLGGNVGGSGGTGGTGGAGSAAPRITGQSGSDGGDGGGVVTAIYLRGGNGGSTPLGFGGQPRRGIAGDAAYGPGGGGAGGSASGNNIPAGGGGGAGEYIEFFINAPANTYSYQVGAGGALGAAGSSGNAGGAGFNGMIIIDELYD